MPVGLSRAEPESNDAFAPTHWSVIAAAKADDDPEKAHAALTQLCQTYWPPLYSFVRSRGYNVHDAQDLTQSFFVFLLDRKIYAGVDRKKGKFRSFLLASIRNFLSDQYDRDHSFKRGGDREFIQLDEEELSEVENNFQAAAALTPDEDRVFERTWAQTLVRDSLANLSRQYQAEGKEKLFRDLKIYLTGSSELLPSYSELARQMGIHESTLRSHVSRLRAHYRDALRAEVRRTVARESEVEEELRELLRVLSND